jgi:pyruvate,water dikinase
MRLARGQVFGVGRRLFQRLGAALRDDGVLERPEDVHYLTLTELRGLVGGAAVGGDPRALVNLRRGQYEAYARSPRLPSRFDTAGVNGAPPEPEAAEATRMRVPGARTLRGLGVAAGAATGRCFVVHDPAVDTPEPGQIIAARTTDPGWIPLLVGAAGILVEQGSLLSHSAIVARELGIPMIVGLAGLFDSVQTGDPLSFDGSTGEVRLDDPKEGGL